MATLQAAITQIQALTEAVSGVRAAPDEPPDQISHFPFVACFPESGYYTPGAPAGMMQGLHNIVVEVHVQLEHHQHHQRGPLHVRGTRLGHWRERDHDDGL